MYSQSLGLALGGGAAKGFVHIGVVKYLQEQKITPQAIAGTSMGAIVGAMVAKGMSYQEIFEAIHGWRYLDLIDLDISQGLIKGDKIMGKIKSYIGDISFAELDIPLTIAATDIDSGEEVVFSEGSVLEAIRCSISLPGIFTLAEHSAYPNMYFIDGGVANNLPASHLDTETVIAVSCQGMGQFEPTDVQEIFGKKFDTTRLTLPKRVVYRSLNIMMTQIEDTYINQNDHITLLRPDLSSVSPFDMEALQDAYDIGYGEAKRVL